MSGSFGLGWKALKSLCAAQQSMAWYSAKLVPEMFKPNEVEAFEWVQGFVKKHKQLPQLVTLESTYPDCKMIDAPEPPSVYVEHLENRMYRERINNANIASQQLLAEDQTQHMEAEKVLAEALAANKLHRFRTRIVDLVKDAPDMVWKAYHDVHMLDNVGQFGWPYLDKSTGGLMPGDVVSIIGRPAAGKTWLVLFGALHNWRKGKRVLVISMEMAPLPIAQRLVAMYGKVNIGQMKVGGYSTHTYKKFVGGVAELKGEHEGFYIVDGNLAASVEDIYALAAQLKCDEVYIDGAYLLRHPNPRLDRFNRITENIELIKRFTSEALLPTVASYQFNRSSTKKAKGEQADMNDVYGSDAIAQISTIMLGLLQEDTVETLDTRLVRVLKGRNGEIGQFNIRWNFGIMDFNEVLEEEVEAGSIESYV